MSWKNILKDEDDFTGDFDEGINVNVVPRPEAKSYIDKVLNAMEDLLRRALVGKEDAEKIKGMKLAFEEMNKSESTLKSTFLTTPEIEEDMDWTDTKPSTLLTRLTSQLDKVRNEIEELDIHNRFREGLFDMDRMEEYQRLNRREARLLVRIGREASK